MKGELRNENWRDVYIKTLPNSLLHLLIISSAKGAITRVPAPISPVMPSPVAARSPTEMKGSAMPRTTPYRNLPHPPPTNYRMRATQSSHCYSITLMWSTVLKQANHPHPADCYPASSEQTSCPTPGTVAWPLRPNTEPSATHAREATHTWPIASQHHQGRDSPGAGFDEVDDDVRDFLESHAEPLSNYELIELDKASHEAENEGDEEEPVRGLDIKTLRKCLGGIDKAQETLKERDPNPARSSKVAHDVEKSVKIYQVIDDEKTRKTKQSSIYLFFKPVRHAFPVTPADPATAGPSTSTADASTAGPSSISSFFKPVERADSATAGPSTYASDSADDDVLSSSALSAEDE
ncbi:hypothetical protein E2C01_034985 [Portunus trituberculatus]|uniref:Uncharacterized protein n=1 Tax=Portunus trituberculatus TaxID=210409 RepID=A0A5B7F715_PORTR|nr:hypothetical protein [Portunus trituberculatus]